MNHLIDQNNVIHHYNTRQKLSLHGMIPTCQLAVQSLVTETFKFGILFLALLKQSVCMLSVFSYCLGICYDHGRPQKFS